MRKHYAVTAMMLLGLAVPHLLILHKQAEAGRGAMPERIQAIPERIAGYRQVGSDENVDDRTLELLETTTVLIRNYVGEQGWPVQLTVVFAGGTRRSLHFPEVCLVGQGWEIREQRSTQVGILFTARRLVLVSGDREQAVMYWFKTGPNVTGNYFVNALHWAANQVAFRPNTASSMIKLTTPIGPAGEEVAFAVLEDFAQKAHPVLMDHVP